MAARQWTLEQRQQQAEKIKQWQPWQNSTGPKTIAGKAIACRNATKAVNELARDINDLVKDVKQLLKQQKAILNSI